MAFFLFTIICGSCVTTKIGSTNYLDDGLYAITITSGDSTSDEELARLAASSIDVNVPFAYGIVNRGRQSDLTESLFWGVPVYINEVRVIISTNIDQNYLASNELKKTTGVINFIVVKQ